MPAQVLFLQMGFGGVMHQIGTETWCFVFKQRGFNAFCELWLFTIIHTTYHTLHSVGTHMSHSGSADTFWVGDMTLNVMILILACLQTAIQPHRLCLSTTSCRVEFCLTPTLPTIYLTHRNLTVFDALIKDVLYFKCVKLMHRQNKCKMYSFVSALD